MAVFFKRYFWVVHVVGVALVAILLASTLNIVVAFRLQQAIANNQPAPKKKATRPEHFVRDFSIANQRNIFGALREEIALADIESADREAQGSWEDAVPTSLNAQLIATAVFPDPTLSLASVLDGSGGANAMAKTYSINECLGSDAYASISDDATLMKDMGAYQSTPCNKLLSAATLVRIEPERIVFYNENERRYEYLSINGAPVKQVARPGSGAKAVAGQGIKKINDRSYDIDQSELDNTLNNLSQIATQARAVPAFEGDKTIGFRLFNIVPDSVFEKIGLKNGDVVTRINGYEMNSPEKGLEIYQKLKSNVGGRITLDVVQGGQKKTIEYNIR